MLNEQEIFKRIFCIINHVRAGMGQLGAADSARSTRLRQLGAGTFRRGVSNGDIKIMNEVH